MAESQGYVEEHAGQVQPGKEKTAEETFDEQICQEAKDHIALVKTVEDKQRLQEDEDLEFEGSDPWLPDHRRARESPGGDDDDPDVKIAPRPCLSIMLLDQPLQQVINEARNARLGLTVKPKAGMANTKIAGYYKGLVRTIQADCGANEVRLWALERATKCGRGAYIIRADFANDGDFDVDLIIDRVLDQSTVYWDVYSQRADRNDQEKCVVSDWMSEDERKRRWPTKPYLAPEGVFDDDKNDWYATDPDNKDARRIRWAAYYKVVHTDRTLLYHPQFGSRFLEDHNHDVQTAYAKYTALGKGLPEKWRARTVDQRTVKIYTVDGQQILEESEWLGRYIPVIPVSGREYLIKGKRTWKGMVCNAKDILRAINVIISSATEIAGTMPRAPYLMVAGQDTGFEEEWDGAATKNFNRLHYNLVDLDGKPAPPPKRESLEIEIQGLMFLLRMLQDMFHSITGSVPPSNRMTNPYDRSGKAIEALQKQGQMGHSDFLDNLATVSMQQEGRVLVDAIPKYYDREGRVLMVMGEENDDETAIMLKRPFIRNAEGEPIPVPCPTCAGKGIARGGLLRGYQLETCSACRGAKFATKENMPKEYQGEAVEYIDLSVGQYKVVTSVDRAHQTKQEEALLGMTELATAAPPLVPVYADLWVRAMGFSGANEIADRLKANNPAAQGDKNGKKMPPEFQAQFQALKMQHEQALAALAEAQKAIDTDAIKNASQKEIATMKIAAAEQLELLKAQAKTMQVDREGAQAIDQTKLEGKIEAMLLQIKGQWDVLLEKLEQAGEREARREQAQLGDIAAGRAAQRQDIAAGRDHQRAQDGEGRALARGEVAASAEHGRSAQDAAVEHARGEASAVAAHGRDQQAAAVDAQRDRTASAEDAAREDARAEADRKAAAKKPDAP